MSTRKWSDDTREDLERSLSREQDPHTVELIRRYINTAPAPERNRPVPTHVGKKAKPAPAIKDGSYRDREKRRAEGKVFRGSDATEPGATASKHSFTQGEVRRAARRLESLRRAGKEGTVEWATALGALEHARDGGWV